MPIIDIRSDTVTRPTAAMRRAMADAEVGDDVLDGDPTVRRLEARIAELTGKEHALFFPTGTMANQAAIAALTSRGDEILVDADSHIALGELAGASVLSGVQMQPVVTAGRLMDAEILAGALRPRALDTPPQSLLCLENTHNGAGGKVTPLAVLRDVSGRARRAGLAVHLDGARLWNAVTATGSTLAEFSACADAVMLSCSKGLGAPVGALLAGSRPVMERAWIARKRFGGGMRQSGILAAAVLHGIDVHWPRMAEDHALAAELAALLDDAGGARVIAPETNIVMIDLPEGVSAESVAAKAAARDVLVAIWTPTRIRAVTHLDVSASSIRTAARVLGDVLDDAARH